MSDCGKEWLKYNRYVHLGSLVSLVIFTILMIVFTTIYNRSIYWTWAMNAGILLFCTIVFIVFWILRTYMSCKCDPRVTRSVYATFVLEVLFHAGSAGNLIYWNYVSIGSLIMSFDILLLISTVSVLLVQILQLFLKLLIVKSVLYPLFFLAAVMIRVIFAIGCARRPVWTFTPSLDFVGRLPKGLIRPY